MRFSCFSRFFGRECGTMKFRMHSGFQDVPNPNNARRLVAFSFHPFYPFAISVQRQSAEYVVNFHVYNPHQGLRTKKRKT